MTGNKTIKIKYFAWLRERVGVAEEQLILSPNIVSVDDLIDHLISKDDNYAFAFEQRDAIRVAINQTHVEKSISLSDAQEVAFFPPMTGG